MAAEPAVVEVPERHRFEIRLNGQRAGLAGYRLSDRTVTFTHTEIDDAYSGQGLGGRLVQSALDTVRGRGLAVLPDCPFVRGWMAKHPDYVDLVPTDRRADYDLPH